MKRASLKTQPNKRRCELTFETHELFLPKCRPITKNPQLGSFIEIHYTPHAVILEVQSLYDYIQSFVGGRDPVRSMEGMIQKIAQDCANAVKTTVIVEAVLTLVPEQKMKLKCKAWPKI